MILDLMELGMKIFIGTKCINVSFGLISKFSCPILNCELSKENFLEKGGVRGG